ncbi:MAG TPA: flippase [Thermoleophilaceae bacterium]
MPGGPGVLGGRRVTADIAVQLVGRVLNMVLGAVVTVVIVRGLGEHRFGQWSTIIAVSELLGYIGDLGLDRVSIRQAAGDPEHEPEWLGALVSLRFLLSIPVTLAFLAIMLVISSDAAMRVSSAVIATLSIVPALSCLGIVFQLRVRNDLSMVVLTINSVLWTASGLVLAALSGSIVAFSLAFVGSFMVSLAAQTVFVRRMAKVRIRASRPLWGELARLSAPVGIAAMLTFAYGRIDQVLVFNIAGSDSAGVYGAMYRILTTSAFVPIAVMTTLFPILSQVDRARMRTLVQKAAEYLAMASLPIFAFVLVAAGPLVRLLFGPEFVHGQNALRVLMGAFVAIGFGYVAGTMILVLRLQRMFVIYAVAALVVNVALNLIFIPHYGFMAAAWATLATELLVQILTIRLVLKQLPLRPKLGRLLRIVIAAAGMGLAVFGLHSAGAGLAWLVLAAAVTYPVLLLALHALVPSEVKALVRREAV